MILKALRKGVVNAIMLRNVFRGTMLIEPPVDWGDEIGNLFNLIIIKLITKCASKYVKDDSKFCVTTF